MSDSDTTDQTTPDVDVSSADPGVETPGNHPNAEAAKYRVRAREAETALEAANARLEQLQRADCERIAGERLSHPGDLFTMSGNSVADYVTDGLVDLGKITADVEAILAERPGLRKLAPAVDPSQGSGNVPHHGRSEPTFGDLFKS